MNNKGVSAIIGVILMVAITVAIAGTVYVYVSGMTTDKEYSGTLASFNRDIHYLNLVFKDGTEFKFKTYTNYDFDKLEINHIYTITYNSYRSELIRVTVTGALIYE